MQKLYCFSRKNFNIYMDEQNWTDETLPDNVAVISICCTEAVRTNFVHSRYDGADDTHRFSHRNNVLNLDFDDIDEEVRHCDGGYDAFNITKEQADEAVKFIEAHKNCDFYIHCHQGKRRSCAFCKFIIDNYGYILGEVHDISKYNKYVLNALNAAKNSINNIE